MSANVLRLPAVGDFWHYFSIIALNFLPAQIINKTRNRQSLVGAVMLSCKCSQTLVDQFDFILGRIDKSLMPILK